MLFWPSMEDTSMEEYVTVAGARMMPNAEQA